MAIPCHQPKVQALTSIGGASHYMFEFPPARTSNTVLLNADEIEWVERERPKLPKGYTTILLIPEDEIEWFASSVGCPR